MVTTGWAYDVIYVPLESSSNNKNVIEKYKTHAFNKVNTVMTVATVFFCCSYCSFAVPWVK